LDGTARRLRSRHRRRPATPSPLTPGPHSARAPALLPAASTSTKTETRAARATSGASALTGTARSVTGLGLRRNGRRLELRGVTNGGSDHAAARPCAIPSWPPPDCDPGVRPSAWHRRKNLSREAHGSELRTQRLG